MNESHPSRYDQLYIFDPQFASSTRLSNNADLDAGIISDLTNMLHNCNTYASLYMRFKYLLNLLTIMVIVKLILELVLI